MYVRPGEAQGTVKMILDGHSHTTESDGLLSPSYVVDWSISQGYNVICITDHNTLSGGLMAEAYAKEKYGDAVTVLVGMEFTCCRIHLNFINIKSDPLVCCTCNFIRFVEENCATIPATSRSSKE